MAEAGNKYDIGQLVTVFGNFQDPESTPTPDAFFDPSVVKCDVRNPATLVVTTYTYPTSGNMRKLGTGKYACDISATIKGSWYYRWYSTGTGQAAEENYFIVNDTKAVAAP